MRDRLHFQSLGRRGILRKRRAFEVVFDPEGLTMQEAGMSKKIPLTQTSLALITYSDGQPHVVAVAGAGTFVEVSRRDVGAENLSEASSFVQERAKLHGFRVRREDHHRPYVELGP